MNYAMKTVTRGFNCVETSTETSQDQQPRPRGRYHGGRRPSSDDSFHSPSVIPPWALVKSSIMKRYHRRRTTRWGVTALSPTMVTLHDTRFVECRWWNDGWTVKTVVTWRSSISMIPVPGQHSPGLIASRETKRQRSLVFRGCRSDWPDLAAWLNPYSLCKSGCC